MNELSAYQEDEWGRCATNASMVVQSWMDRFHKSREAFWEEKTAKQKRPVKVVRSSFYLFPENDVEQSSARCCHLCSEETNPKATTKKRRPRRILTGDSLMQCLECDFIGCAPSSMVKGSSQCILQHLLLSGHRFAVTCGERANLFCFGCGDLAYHEAFEQEKERIDYAHQLTFMAWKHCDIQRSFDAFQFIKTQDYGIVWRGLVATYPSLVPRKHVASAEVAYRCQALFEGRVQEPWLMNINMPTALKFCAKQSLLPKSGRHNITAPVGVYNLGNTCFKSSILQCLVHCRPLQRFFLEHVRHDHNSCKYSLRYATALSRGRRRGKSGSAIRDEDEFLTSPPLPRQENPFVRQVAGIHEVETQIMAKKLDTVLFLSTRSCQTCKSINPQYNRMARVVITSVEWREQRYGGHDTFAKAEASGNFGKPLGRYFGVDTVPIFIFFRNGEQFGSPLSASKLPSPELSKALHLLRTGQDWDSSIL